MSLEIIAKLKDLAEKGIADLKEAIGYLESEFESAQKNEVNEVAASSTATDSDVVSVAPPIPPTGV